MIENGLLGVIDELHQQLETERKRGLLLRGALERFALIDLRFETLPETFAFDVLGARKALAATDDLSQYILCEKEPVGYGLFDGDGICYAIGRHPSSMCISGKTFRSELLYRARRQE